MAEYISKQAFKEKYLACGWLPEMSEEEFDAFPPADVAPVVRCKDCRHFEVDDGLPDRRLCLRHGHRWTAPRPDDFCSRGERKEAAND